jgi:hypothetical protein
VPVKLAGAPWQTVNDNGAIVQLGKAAIDTVNWTPPLALSVHGLISVVPPV